jgi:homoaconitase/3-isopropylmalate dehydratase large subunit
LLERFSEGEGSSDSDDAPLAVRARIRKGKPSRSGISTLVPHVSGPNSVKVSTLLPDLERRRFRIQKAYLVSRTNSRSSDLAAAAAAACNKLRG